VYVHPDDARARGLEDGATVEVRSATATVRVPLRVSDEMMPGAVALPHGWGHQEATGLTIARTTGGANVNLLAKDGPTNLEAFSG
ncbi:molybdopterin dinucleotide binding domain-containing protein, partial [Salmonella sp. SAL4457]|uniref:molybdopterin dinucleotide binding domain-containing protein n=1 Tax=Salmonella sp. SAL4457 TaxID=3159912 RepID=UPI003978A01C